MSGVGGDARAAGRFGAALAAAAGGAGAGGGHGNEAWAAAWSLLLATGPDRELYELCRAGWRELPEYAGKSPLFDGRMWSGACRGVLNLLTEQVAQAGTLDAWAETLASCAPGTEALPWLERFYAKAGQYLRIPELYCTPILPDQYGKFRAPAGLKLDKIEDEELKAISVCFRAERPECDVPAVLLERRIELPGWNLPALGPDAVASGVNAALQQFLARASLPEAPMELQEACTRLLGWIRERPQKAKRCFPAFCGEEEQMKLLTPRAAVSLRKKADRFNELLALAGTDDSETLIQLIQERTQGAGLPAPWEDFDPDSGILMDGDWDGLDDGARGERLRRIGEAGERCAFRAVVNHFVHDGLILTADDGASAHLRDDAGKRQVAVCRADAGNFKQPGWDISIRLQENMESAAYYLEVKTHTGGSQVRSRLPLSDAQMRKAAALGGRYILLLVIYDENRDQAVELRPFRDVLGYIAAGVLHSASGRFDLEVCPQAAGRLSQ